MSTAERDYYELLGVSRNADDGAIKKAFRRLARELHPDVSAAPDAEVRFREVSEAYEVLSNAERALYDRYGHAGLRSGGFSPSSTSTSAAFTDLFSAFFGDDVFGSSARGPRQCVPIVPEALGACGGRVVPGAPRAACLRFAGSYAQAPRLLSTCSPGWTPPARVSQVRCVRPTCASAPSSVATRCRRCCWPTASQSTRPSCRSVQQL